MVQISSFFFTKSTLALVLNMLVTLLMLMDYPIVHHAIKVESGRQIAWCAAGFALQTLLVIMVNFGVLETIGDLSRETLAETSGPMVFLLLGGGRRIFLRSIVIISLITRAILLFMLVRVWHNFGRGLRELVWGKDPRSVALQKGTKAEALLTVPASRTVDTYLQGV